ncbi:MAG: squalene/phytoene synthase family protein [Candidatus Symbiothrix sp.]|jgi:phytoene/squalene synthetase|nr:squalene/phytoene synthase family protein [Candidatus Symbiothrix sp.]
MNEEIRQLTLVFCKSILKHYTKSYFLSFKLFSREIRNPLYVIYAYLRIVDEIVDSFEIQDKENIVNNLYEATFNSLDKNYNINLIIDLFQHVIKKYKIEKELFDSFFKSMLMDIHQNQFTKEELNKYIDGVAICVGKICLKIASNNNDDMYETNVGTISNIAGAFQKISLIRDIKYDKQILHRNYLKFITNDTEFSIFIREIKMEIRNGIKGIISLPKGCRLSILLATGIYEVYLSIIICKKKLKLYHYE